MLRSSQSNSKKEGFGKYALAHPVYTLFVTWLALGFEQPGDFGYLLACAIIAIASFVVLFNPWNGDLFEPIKIAAAFYGLSFGIGPLLLGPYGSYDIWYLGSKASNLLSTGSYLSLLGFACMLFAYYLTPTPSYRSKQLPPTQSLKSTRNFLVGGIVVLFIGLASYLILVRASGGLGHFLSYTGGRAEIFQTAFGGYFWGTFFLISGLSIVGAAIVAHRPRTVFALGIVISILLALFQGRAAAIAPIFVSMILIYYGYKRISARTLAISVVVLLFVTSLLGTYRAADKNMVSRDVSGFILDFSTRARDNFLGTISTDIERLDMFLVCYKYVQKEGEGLGGNILINWLGPLNRHLFGGALQTRSAGQFLFGLLNPHAKGARTGKLPSLPGEFYLSFGLWGLILGQLIYGALLKQISVITRHRPIRPLALAVYPYLAFITTYLVITGTVQLIYLVPVMMGIFIAVLISGFRTHKSVPSSDNIDKKKQQKRFAQRHGEVTRRSKNGE